jgi:hypothetical protein
MTAESDLTAVTDELYARPPAEFVARRDELARQARTSGDKALAAEIKALRRPSVGAWYLNAGVRAGLTALDQLLQLGRDLRDAQGGGDFALLRELGAQRSRLISAAVREIGGLLAESGTGATPAGLEEVRATLTSALADAVVAEQLAAGRLDQPHVYAGLGDVSAVAVTEQSARPPKASPTVPDEEAARLAAERRVAEEAAARRVLAEAEAELAARVEASEEAADALEAAQHLVDERAAELADARAALKTAKAHAETTAAERRAALKRVNGARRSVQE